MTLEEYKTRMAEELKKLDPANPGDKESGAYKLLSEAARDREVLKNVNDWVELSNQYWDGVRRA